jgi:cobalamin biosynthesis protein CobD/CbiB
VEQWPEGAAADPEAARQRYDSDMKASREALREVVRADLPTAHLGPGIVAVVAVAVGCFATPLAGALVAGAFAALFLGALAVMFPRGVQGVDALRRSYLFTFGWASWF